MHTRSGLRVVVLAAILLAAGSGSQVEVHAAGRTVEAPPAAAGQPPITVGDCPALGEETGDASVLVGTWIRCAGPPFAGALVDDIGLDVTADGHFYRVFELPDGTLARATGANQEGTYEWAGQLNWNLLGSGSVLTHPQFFTGPPMLYLEGGLEPMYFVRWEGAPPVTDRPPADSGACGALADVIEPTSVEHVEELLTGVWIRCAGPVVFVTQGDAVGVEIAADGRWYMVYEADDGSLIRGEGADREGTWSVRGMAPDYQFDAAILGGGGEGSTPVFFAAPVRSMRLLTMIGDADYRIWTGDPPVSGTPTGQVSECGILTDVITPTSAAQAAEFLIGSWTLCDGISPFGPPGLDGELGLEFTDDGHYYRLIRQADGTIARATGTGMEGTWTTMTNSGKGGIQIEIATAGLGTDSVLPTFFGTPHGVRFSGTGTSADYLRASIPAQPSPVTPTTPPTLPATGAGNVVVLAVAALSMFSGTVMRSARHRTT